MDPCYALWASFLDELWESEPPERILDVCCGTGLMTAELLARGLTVVGVDASPAMLAGARDRLGDEVELVECVLPDLPVDGMFDAAVSTLDGLNYLTLPDLQATLVALGRVVRPSGWLVFDVHGEATLDFAAQNAELTGERAGSRYSLVTRVSDRTCSTTITFEAADPAESFAETHVQHVHRESEIRDALDSAGFTDVRVVDEYRNDPVTPQTLRTTWIARRGGES